LFYIKTPVELPMSDGQAVYQPTERTRVRRLAERGSYDRATVHAILDEGLVCHVGFVVDGQPYVIPTLYVRDGDTLYFHGSTGSRTMRALAAGADVCLTVTLVDGLVLARSVFHHSANYRSVLVLGRAEPVLDDAGKDRVLRLLVEHVVPGRTADARGPNPRELAATAVLGLRLDEASAKVRNGPPVDDEEDHALPVWAGVLPLGIAVGTPLPDDRLHDGLPVPPYLAGWGCDRVARSSR
jgi:nitroimidazol reductase NimA-like FMN-containing flavoprotein (pyridoxamine 5'-phosphate oxidase superfamily)